MGATQVEDSLPQLERYVKDPPFLSNVSLAYIPSKVVDFVIWLLFKKCPVSQARPKHLLCNGLRKGARPKGQEPDFLSTLAVPGVFQQHPNESLERLKQSPWNQYLSFLGQDGDAIFSTLLLDCGLFIKLGHGDHNYLQVSGIPISDLNGPPSTVKAVSGGYSEVHLFPRKLSDIQFVRNRILYAKPSLNKRGNVHFGMKHVHVLQRYCRLDELGETVHIMKHVFPRQFGYHNVFTSQNDPKESSQRFPDYTYREQEFSSGMKHPKYWMPRRLRGAAEKLIYRVRKRHMRCSYTQLLRYYCPVTHNEANRVAHPEKSHPLSSPRSTGLITQAIVPTNSDQLENPTHAGSDGLYSFLAHATPSSHVSAFCRAIISNVIPRNTLGVGPDSKHNWKILSNSIDQFVQRRRFETLSLHEVCSNLRVRQISWLQPPKLHAQSKTSKSDMGKRLEILHELVYYVFDSLLIPLIRSNFYVTESGVNRNKLFFFRHDVWRKLSEPSLSVLRLKLYQTLKPKEVKHIFDSQALGYSNVRLLPKAEGTRPITNLRRRMLSNRGNRRLLGPSINAQLGPVFSALRYERQEHPARLGGTIFSIGGLHQKLKDFKQMVPRGEKLYFVKLDIQSCFDTIPQAQLLSNIDKVMNHPQYRMTRISELKAAESGSRGTKRRCRQKFANLAQPAENGAVLSESVASRIVQGKDGTVLMDHGNERIWQHGQLMRLLKEHVQHNIVKIGKKHSKQTNGIPQGSVLSSMLCSFFYSDFELRHLNFLHPCSSMLVRLIDDFLLVTTDKYQALKFLQVMLNGNEDYGISVNPDKTLANFEAQVCGQNIPRHQGRAAFPFCGMVIDTSNLEVRKDWQRKDRYVSNGLTVDLGRNPGATFRRKVLLSFKMQLHAMLVDTGLNSQDRIVSTNLEAFEETAIKMHQYAKNMTRRVRPSASSIRELIQELIKVALKLGQRKHAGTSPEKLQSPIAVKQMGWIAATAFERVLLRKQRGYEQVLAWLRSVREGCEASFGTRQKVLKRVLDVEDRVLVDCRY